MTDAATFDDFMFNAFLTSGVSFGSSDDDSTRFECFDYQKQLLDKILMPIFASETNSNRIELKLVGTRETRVEKDLYEQFIDNDNDDDEYEVVNDDLLNLKDCSIDREEVEESFPGFDAGIGSLKLSVTMRDGLQNVRLSFSFY